MRVKIKQFDPTLPLPKYQSPGAACVDLCARLEVRIEPQSIGYIPLNVALEVPEDCWVLLAARSSTHKLGLMPANGVGIIDSDFRGDNDEYKLVVYNFRNEAVTVERGQRIAQLLVSKYERIEFEVVEKLGGKDRGAFGSTGHK